MSRLAEPRVTIVLTLKDRPEFTRRWMGFMDGRRCPYKILIADGGADPGIEAHLGDSRNYPSLDYEYIRYPYDGGWTDFYAKQVDVCSRVKTDYLLLADNDDFYVIDQIPSLIDFLDAHPDYAGCRGATAFFSLLSGEGEVVNAPTAAGYKASGHENRSIEDDTFIERIETYLRGVFQYSDQANWYCVYRTSNIVDSLNTVYKYRFADVVLNEILLLLTLMRHGKIKVLDPQFYLRQVGSSQAEAGLLAGDNVLDLLMINDAFHDFSEFGRMEGWFADPWDRVRAMKALADYVGTWCAVSGRYGQSRGGRRLAESLRTWLSRHPWLFRPAYGLGLRFSPLLRRTRKMWAIRIPAIEDSILKSRSGVP